MLLLDQMNMQAFVHDCVRLLYICNIVQAATISMHACTHVSLMCVSTYNSYNIKLCVSIPVDSAHGRAHVCMFHITNTMPIYVCLCGTACEQSITQCEE